ncbi:hypothetical protein [Rhodococcus sp. NPDC058639]|uniref:hypothetical protein n=1 Tax=Rhodococcus sp. NPDC058639 TaxID=3346570 RepID=UPI003660F287
MTNYYAVDDSTDTTPIPRVLPDAAPPRPAGLPAHRAGQAGASQLVRVRRRRRTAVVAKKTPSLWFIGGLIVLLTAFGVAIGAAVSNQVRHAPEYQSVYVPAHPLVPIE